MIGGVVMGGYRAVLTRRDFLQATLLSSGLLLVGADKINGLKPYLAPANDSLLGEEKLGTLEFVGEGPAPLGVALNQGLDARLYTDLSSLTSENPVTPVERFYVRTRASELLDYRKPWVIKVAGLIDAPLDLTLEHLKSMAKPAGLHLMECSGNARATRFALLSVADWGGVPITEILDRVKIKSHATRARISGFDRFGNASRTSIPGADWIFTFEELKSSKAFLATEMNGQALAADHGAPVRLVVPGWYGCTCIKWVNEITLVDDEVEATSQMQEFAGRTHQPGTPRLARDYMPASIDQAAMPIRVEKWRVDGGIKHVVVGILWGGSRPVNLLEIRFNPEEDYVRVDSFKQATNDPWSFWTHTWAPKHAGTYSIRLRVKNPPVTTKRLDSGHYVRSVEVTAA